MGDFVAFRKFKYIFFGKKATDALSEKKIKFWSKKNNIGIIAKMAVKRCKELNLHPINNLIREPKEEMFKIFTEIL